MIGVTDQHVWETLGWFYINYLKLTSLNLYDILEPIKRIDRKQLCFSSRNGLKIGPPFFFRARSQV